MNVTRSFIVTMSSGREDDLLRDLEIAQDYLVDLFDADIQMRDNYGDEDNSIYYDIDNLDDGIC